MRQPRISYFFNPTRIRWLLWASTGFFSFLFFFIFSNFAQDDAFITYRYARNLAQGLGFVYNPGEWVLGTTTPLYTLLLAALAGLTRIDIPLLSTGVSVLSLWAGSGLMYEIGEPHNRGFAFLAAFLFLTCPFFPMFVGMESCFLLCLALLTVWTYEKKRLQLTGLLCGLLVLVRYELVIMVGMILLMDVLKSRKIPFWIITGLVPAAAWLTYASITFGSPIPLSATAKLLAPHIPFAVGFGYYLYTFFIELPGWFLVLFFFILGAASLLIKRNIPQGYSILVLYGVLYFVLSSFLAGSFPWYYAPLIPGLSVLITMGIDNLYQFSLRAQTQFNLHKLKQLVLLLPVSLAIFTILLQISLWHQNYTKYRGQEFDNRIGIYREVSDWLTIHAAKNQTIACSEIGIIGFYSNMKIIDLSGLVTPSLLPWVQGGLNPALSFALDQLSVDYVLVPTDRLNQNQIVTNDTRFGLVQIFGSRFNLYGRR